MPHFESPPKTVELVNADYFEGIDLGLEEPLTFKACHHAEVKLALNWDGTVDENRSLVDFYNPRRNVFIMSAPGVTVLSEITVGSGKLTHDTRPGLSLLVWPATGRLPEGLQDLEKSLEDQAEGPLEDSAEHLPGSQRSQQSPENQAEGSQSTQQLQEDPKQDYGLLMNGLGDTDEEEDDGTSNGT